MFDKTPPKVFVHPSSIHGLGVFASQNIKSGETIEKCPLLKLDIDNKNELLADYRFWWTENDEHKFYVLAMGYGSFYNHSDIPNSYFFCNSKTSTIDFVSIKDIAIGEEIFIDYGGEEYWSSRKYIQVK